MATARDGVGYRMTGLWLDDDEFAALVADLRQVLPPFIHASLADTLMPEAFEHGKPWNSFATAAGFFLAFMLATV